MIASLTLSGEYRAGDSSTTIIVAFEDAIVFLRLRADPGTPGVTGSDSSGSRLNSYPLLSTCLRWVENSDACVQ